MEKDGTQTEKDARVLGDIGRLMKTFDPYGTGFSLAKDHLTPLVEHLREYVRVGEVEKKEHGEVMTPIWLVEDMLDKLPEHVWSDPSLKWLDPCNGCGVFPSVVVSRLMAGLQTEFPDQVERYRHIVENMIHACDIQAKNCFLHMVAFDPKDLFDMNIYCGSFLDEEFDKFAKGVWGVEKFDVVIGNPPYQELKPGNKKSQAIWPMFVERSLDLLKDGGYLNFVHPGGWRSPSGMFKKTQGSMLSNQFLYLSMNSRAKGIKWFGATTDIDWYVIKKSPPSCLTEISFHDNSVQQHDLSSVEFIPNNHIEEVFSLIAKPGVDLPVESLADSVYHTQREHVSKEKINVVHSRSAYGTDKKNTSKNKLGNFRHPVVYTCLASGQINLWWSNTDKNGHFGIPKVFWSNGASSVHIDDNGKYGLTQFSYAIVDSQENLKNIKKALESERFIKLMKAVAFNNSHKYNHRIIALFRKDFWKEFVDV